MSNCLLKIDNLRWTLRCCVYYKKCLNILLRNNSNYQSVACNVDAMDNFTSQLMEKKYQKWKAFNLNQNFKKQEESEINRILKKCDQCLNENEYSKALINAIESNDIESVKEIINNCIRHKYLPTLAALKQSLILFSQTGEIEGIRSIKQLCDTQNSPVLIKHTYFNLYLAKAVWIKGNVSESLKMFDDIYRNNEILRREIRAILKFLISRDIHQRSEAALINAINFCEHLVQDFNDYYVLMCIWEVCILSEWYSDQCKALELLKRHINLHKALGDRLPFIIAIILKKHQTEIVYRLLEEFLKTEERSISARIISALFDYKVRHKDLQGCAEILKWSVEQKLVLPNIQKQKFLNLVIDSKVEETSSSNIQEKPPSHKYSYKF